VRVDGAAFEPEAYARYYPDAANLTADELQLHYQVFHCSCWGLSLKPGVK